jgi:hypothetical protein
MPQTDNAFLVKKPEKVPKISGHNHAFVDD